MTQDQAETPCEQLARQAAETYKRAKAQAEELSPGTAQAALRLPSVTTVGRMALPGGVLPDGRDGLRLILGDPARALVDRSVSGMFVCAWPATLRS